HGIAAIKNLRHDFITEIQIGAFNPGLLRRNDQAHELGTTRGFALGFTELGYLIKLTVGGLAIDELKHQSLNENNRRPPAPAISMNVRRVSQLGVIDVVRARAGDVLLREKACCADRLGMIWICGWV